MLVEFLEENQQQCSIKSQFGVECLGCGTQRAIIDLLKGDIKQSFVDQPAVLLFIIYVIGILILWKSKPSILKHFVIYGFTIIGASMILRFSYNFFL